MKMKLLMAWAIPSILFAALRAPHALADEISGIPLEPLVIRQNLEKGIAQDVLVLFHDVDIKKETDEMRKKAKLEFDDKTIANHWKNRLEAMKSDVQGKFADKEMALLKDYSYFPIIFVRIHSTKALDKLVALPEVSAVYENQRHQLHGSSSNLVLIEQPAAQSLGHAGAGTVVAVIDSLVKASSGILKYDSNSCKYDSYYDSHDTPWVDVTSSSTNSDFHIDSHGTEMATIIKSIAPSTCIWSVGVVDREGYINDYHVINAVYWAYHKKVAQGWPEPLT